LSSRFLSRWLLVWYPFVRDSFYSAQVVQWLLKVVAATSCWPNALFMRFYNHRSIGYRNNRGGYELQRCCLCSGWDKTPFTTMNYKERTHIRRACRDTWNPVPLLPPPGRRTCGKSWTPIRCTGRRRYSSTWTSRSAATPETRSASSCCNFYRDVWLGSLTQWRILHFGIGGEKVEGRVWRGGMTPPQKFYVEIMHFCAKFSLWYNMHLVRSREESRPRRPHFKSATGLTAAFGLVIARSLVRLPPGAQPGKKHGASCSHSSVSDTKQSNLVPTQVPGR